MEVNYYSDRKDNRIYEGTEAQLYFLNNDQKGKFDKIENYLGENLNKVDLNNYSNGYLSPEATDYELKILTGLVCNLSCPHCYQTHDDYTTDDLSLRKMDHTIVEEILSIINYMSDNNKMIRRTEILGGEPLLGIHYEKIDKIMAAAVEHADKLGFVMDFFIPTNAMQIDKFMDLFRKYEMLCTISFGITLDGLKERHNRIRPQNERGTFERTINAINTINELTNAEIHIRYHLNPYYPFQFDDLTYDYYKFILENYFEFLEAGKMSFLIERLHYAYDLIYQIDPKIPEALLMMQHAYTLDKVASKLNIDITPVVQNYRIIATQTREYLGWFLYWFGRDGIKLVPNNPGCPVQSTHNILLGQGGMGICEAVDHKPVDYPNENETIFEKFNEIEMLEAPVCTSCRFKNTCEPCNKSDLALKLEVDKNSKCVIYENEKIRSQLNQSIYSKLSFDKPIREQLEVLEPVLSHYKNLVSKKIPSNISDSFFTDRNVENFLQFSIISE